MIVIEPVEITKSRVISSSLPTNDYPQWVSGTTYAKYDRRMWNGDVFERLTDGAGTDSPNSDTTNWAWVGPGKRYAPFDVASSTIASATGSMTWTVRLNAPNTTFITAIFLENVFADSVTISVVSGVTTVYSRTVQLSKPVSGSVFGSTRRMRSVVLTDLPAVYDPDINVTVTGASSAQVSLGRCVMGPWWPVGDTKFGVSIGITSYSVKEVDAYGNPTLVKRPAADEISFPVRIATVDIGEIKYRLKQLDGKFAVFVGDLDMEFISAYGWFDEFRTDIQYPKVSQCTLKVQGAI